MPGVNTKHEAGAKSEDMWMGLGTLNVAKEKNITKKPSLANLAANKAAEKLPNYKVYPHACLIIHPSIHSFPLIRGRVTVAVV